MTTPRTPSEWDRVRASNPEWRRRLSRADQRDLDVMLYEAELRTTTDEARKAVLTNIVAGLKALPIEGGTMAANKHESAFRKSVEALADGVVQIGTLIKATDERKDMYPEAWYAKERDRLLSAARQGDREAVRAAQAYADDALAEARSLRAKAEATRPAADRLADEMERQRLASSSLDAGEFVAQAQAMLDAGQPRRASFLLSVAKDKGARLTGDVEHAVENALDRADDTRREARALEDSVASNTHRFAVARLKALADAGIGIGTDGMAGYGSVAEVTAANSRRKMLAWANGDDPSAFADAPRDEATA